MNGIIFYEVHEGTYVGPAFVHYIQQLLYHMNLYPEANSVLVMDNCEIHHLNVIALLCGAK